MPDPAIDFTLIDFPTDHLTVKDLRKRWPHGFDTSPPPGQRFDDGEIGLRLGPYRRKNLDDILGSTIDTERELAELAFCATLGREPPEPLRGDGRRDESAELLAHTYVGYGLATGDHHAMELIRDIEAQGAAQARKFQAR
jgi:hypothetical protein